MATVSALAEPKARFHRALDAGEARQDRSGETRRQGRAREGAGEQDLIAAALQKRGDRLLLECAARLQDVGYVINYDQHHKHSYHLIRNSRLPGIRAHDLELIANDENADVGALFASGLAETNEAEVTLSFLRAWRSPVTGMVHRHGGAR